MFRNTPPRVARAVYHTLGRSLFADIASRAVYSKLQTLDCKWLSRIRVAAGDYLVERRAERRLRRQVAQLVRYQHSASAPIPR
jgi:hypothetical protein